ncbi:TDRD1 protein, partial [Sapayoa aenigma]|nr:TDRD1 protein [Sapayoa aenigma]
AIKCSVANYDQKGKRWNEFLVSFFPQLMGKHCSVAVVDLLQEEVMLSFAADVLPDCGKLSENHPKGREKKIPEAEESPHCATAVAKFVSLSIGDEFSAVVSHVQDPDTFFCQQMNNACQLAELEASLNEYCGKFPSSPCFRPAAGNVCCAQFTEDNLWYRATVTAYASEDTVLVNYMDYGNSDSIPLTKLRPVIPQLMALPAQAIKCTLAGVKPPLGAWTSECISLMKKLVKDNKVFTVKVVDTDSSRSVVELVDASVTPAINVSSRLLEEGCAAEDSRGDAEPAGGESGHVLLGWHQDTMNSRTFKWMNLTLNQTVSVIVCTLYTPGEFYCQISNNHELLALNSLNKSISEYCEKTPPDVFEPENGEPCCAFFSGNWYRAVVQNVSSGGTVRVSFVDYGNVEEVPRDKLRQISSSFLELPFQAIKCWLTGVKPDNSKWSPEATIRFHMYTSGLELQATVTSLSKDGAGVVLIDNSTACPKVINEILTSENLDVKEVLQEKNNFPNKSVDQKVTTVGHWKSIKLAVGETIPVLVTEVVSPDLFYAVPWFFSVVQKKLYRKLSSLGEYYRSCKKQPFQPKLGEACSAQFSGNGRWYRAVVLEASCSAVRVLYADYGNTETLPLSNVQPIPDSYLKLPFQTITCSLAGVEKAEWSPLVLDKLKDMLLKQYVTITVKEINGNVNLVTVEKRCENGSLNVAGKLLKESLDNSCSAENSQNEHRGDGDETKCCCEELKVQLKKHKQVLLFLLNKYMNPDGFAEMKNLLQH